MSRRAFRCVLILLAAFSTASLPVARTTFDAAVVQKHFAEHFGTARMPVLASWLELTGSLQRANDKVKLSKINSFVNERTAFDSDLNIWHSTDYWATPLETLSRGRGDCEDFAILKYVSLRLAGMPSSKLRLVYAKARLATPTGPRQQAHMVLAYYAQASSEPLILDNIDPAIRPASRRRDLAPVFSFNSEGIFGDLSGSNKVAARIGQLSRWQDAWQRIVAEGFE